VALGDNGQGEVTATRGLRVPRAVLADRARPGDDYEPQPNSSLVAAVQPTSSSGAAVQPRSSSGAAVQIFVYDNYPGGIGLSEPLYRLHGRLLRESEALIASCACRDGCPSCVGPVGEVGSRGKEVALALLAAVRGHGVGDREDVAPLRQ